MEKVDWSKAPEWANAVVASDDGEKYWVEKWGIVSKRQKLSENSIDHYLAEMTGYHLWTLVELRDMKPFKMEYEGREVEILATCDTPYSQAAIRFPDGQLAVVCKGWLKSIKTDRDKWIEVALTVYEEGSNEGLGQIYDELVAKKGDA